MVFTASGSINNSKKPFASVVIDCRLVFRKLLRCQRDTCPVHHINITITNWPTRFVLNHSASNRPAESVNDSCSSSSSILRESQGQGSTEFQTEFIVYRVLHLNRYPAVPNAIPVIFCFKPDGSSSDDSRSFGSYSQLCVSSNHYTSSESDCLIHGTSDHAILLKSGAIDQTCHRLRDTLGKGVRIMSKKPKGPRGHGRDRGGPREGDRGDTALCQRLCSLRKRNRHPTASILPPNGRGNKMVCPRTSSPYIVTVHRHRTSVRRRQITCF